MLNTWNATLQTQQGAGTALTNSTTATSLLPGQAKFTLPAQALQWIGQKLRVKASGRLSTAASAQGNVTLDVRMGSVIAFSGGAIAMAASATNLTWRFEADLTVLTLGSGTGTTLYGAGELKCIGLTAPLNLLPASASGAGTGFDSTIANVVDFFATFSAASASNSIRCDEFELISCL